MVLKTLIKQRQKLLSTILIVGFILVSNLTFLAPFASAVTPADNPAAASNGPLFYTLTVDEQAKVFAELSAIFTDYNGGCGLKSTVSESDIGAGKWFNNNATPMGHNVDPNDGQLNCENENQWFSNLLDQAGYAGSYTTAARQVFSVKNGEYSFIDTQDNKAESDDRLRGLLATGFFGSASSKPSTIDYITYYQLLSNFTATKACNAKPFTTDNDAIGKQKATIYVWNSDTKKMEQTTYVYPSDKKSAAIGIGWGGLGGSDGKLSCENIASNLNNKTYADAYALYAVNHPDDPNIDTAQTGGTNGEAADDKIDTCSISGNPLSWVLCPIYDGLGSFSDWVLNSILSPFLSTTPISTDPSSTTYKIWSTFRVYGNIFLIIALLVIVFGQSIGGGLVDAYTAKKVLPRLLVAAILINLSIYIVALLVDLTNIAGGAIGDAITAPLKGNTGLFDISPSGVQAGGFGTLLIGATAGAATITGIIGAIVGPAATAGIALGIIVQALPFLLLFIIVPALLAMLAVLLTLIFRKALILALILVSPVAFALYCLPNTEQYFRKWWDLLFKTLLIYPIVMVIFAIADVLAVTTLLANGNDSMVGYLFAFLLQFVPLFMIPFAFKMAGGAIGAAHGALTGYRQRGMEVVKGNINNPNSLRNRAKYKALSGLNRQRSSIYTSSSDFSKSGSRWKRALGTTAARSVGFGNLELIRAQMNEEQDKLAAAQYGTGGDNTIRAFWAKQYNGPTEYYTDSNGEQKVARERGRWYTYQQPDGSYKEWSAADVSTARSHVGKDMSRIQAYGKYEMSKAANDDNLEEFMPTFLERAQESGMNVNQANEIWAGMKFAHQQTRKELKYSSIGTRVNPATGKARLVFNNTDHAGLSNELVDTMRKGDFASFRSSTAKKAFEGFQAAKAKVDAGNASAEDKFIYDNYQDLADHLNTSLFGIGSSSEAARQAAAQAAAASAGDGETADSTGYGLGASARAEKEWRNFVMAARRGPAVSGGGTGDASEGGPSIITPGGNPR